MVLTQRNQRHDDNFPGKGWIIPQNHLQASTPLPRPPKHCAKRSFISEMTILTVHRHPINLTKISPPYFSIKIVWEVCLTPLLHGICLIGRALFQSCLSGREALLKI
jgi:hypothetical protein